MFSGTWFPDWTHKPITEITKDMVARQQTKLTETSGPANANLALRFLQALLNCAIAQYEKTKGEHLIAENPIHRLSRTRVWNRDERRRTVIKRHQLSAWYVIRATSQGT
ncbi:hypothetical protein [Thiohalobacter thiocyanaticus]|nr:hypothetical protein [Thiohalobacter thiocyanaticus]